ncbi:hypothetical protein [Elizabethkingia anophelis]|uniref:hypothetical protein n=1 Tax=Elizabethkingia anophelis TaxID=1117645 RepID=UPI00259BCE41|nr:hypothetical protein [Elizabethkingia anophelis]WJK01760.1 hypothetical protein QTN78_08570 [Elizabethkingia anophelis]
MLNFLKKYWYVVLIVLSALHFLGYFIIKAMIGISDALEHVESDTIERRLKSKDFFYTIRIKAILGSSKDAHQSLMKPFSNMLNAYAKAYNKKYNRRGSLFLDFLKRKRVDSENYLLKLVHYIHNNPVNHGLF